MTAAYTVELTCPKCGAELVHENSATRDSGYSAIAVAKCPTWKCPTWELRVELITCGAPPPTPRPERVR